jgi:phosphatidylglycerophosphatase A
LSAFAPGTAGTAFAWVTYGLLRHAYPADANFGLFLAFMFVFGTWCVQITGRHLGEPDHGAIVWDEIVPFWALLMFLPPAIIDSPHGVLISAAGLSWQAAGFVLFRVFDITKPPPASYFDRRVKNGLGVMLDDVVAAGYAALALASARVLIERLG